MSGVLIRIGILLAVAASMALAVTALAQTAPRFSVAAIKSCDPKTSGDGYLHATPGGVDDSCDTLRDFIWTAYGYYASDKRDIYQPVDEFHVEGGPAWVRNDNYTIVARTERPTDEGIEQGAMMRALLEERFQLKVHLEPRTVRVYDLVVAKGGLHLPAAKVACVTPQEMPLHLEPGAARPPACFFGRIDDSGFTLLGSDMTNFCYAISSRMPALFDGMELVDKTGISGRFDFELKFPIAVEDSGRPGASRYSDRMVQALRKVGLRLVPGEATRHSIVIDHVERPSGN